MSDLYQHKRVLHQLEAELAGFLAGCRDRLRLECVRLLDIAQRKLRTPIELVGCNGQSWVRQQGVRSRDADRYIDLNVAVYLGNSDRDRRYRERFPELVALFELLSAAEKLDMSPQDAKPSVEPMGRP